MYFMLWCISSFALFTYEAGYHPILQGALFRGQCRFPFALIMNIQKPIFWLNLKICFISNKHNDDRQRADSISSVISLFQHFLSAFSSFSPILFGPSSFIFASFNSRHYISALLSCGAAEVTDTVIMPCIKGSSAPLKIIHSVFGFKSKAPHSQLEETTSNRQTYCAVCRNISIIKYVNKPYILSISLSG